MWLSIDHRMTDTNRYELTTWHQLVSIDQLVSWWLIFIDYVYRDSDNSNSCSQHVLNRVLSTLNTLGRGVTGGWKSVQPWKVAMYSHNNNNLNHQRALRDDSWICWRRALNKNGYDQKNEPTIFLPSGVHTKPKPKTNLNPENHSCTRD